MYPKETEKGLSQAVLPSKVAVKWKWKWKLFSCLQLFAIPRNSLIKTRWPLSPRVWQPHRVGSVRCSDGGGMSSIGCDGGGTLVTVEVSTQITGDFAREKAQSHLLLVLSKGHHGLGKCELYIWRFPGLFSDNIFDVSWFPSIQLVPLLSAEPCPSIQKFKIPPCVCAQPSQSCPILCDPMSRSLLGFSVNGILQARILEWVAVPSSRRFSQSRYKTYVSYVSHIGGRVLYHQCHLGSPRQGG